MSHMMSYSRLEIVSGLDNRKIKTLRTGAKCLEQKSRNGRMQIFVNIDDVNIKPIRRWEV